MATEQPLARAFLSHSSQDKAFVRQVFDQLGATLAELDEATFEPAKFNKDVILNAIDRCGIFVLFGSQHSVKSNWVAMEIRSAIDRIKANQLNRILVFCADKQVFQQLNPALKDYNIVRIEKTPIVCARQIRGLLAEVFAETYKPDTFVARDENLTQLKQIIVDPSKTYRTLAISGFDRLGRRKLVRRFCQDLYRSFNVPSVSVSVDHASSLDDIYRQLLGLQYRSLEQAALLDKLKTFNILVESKKIETVGKEIRLLHAQREFVQFIDAGGIISDTGDFTHIFQRILEQNPDISELIHVCILYRTPPASAQSRHQTIAFYRLPPLSDAQAELAIQFELKRRKATITKDQMLRLISACDGHPANIDYVIGYIFHGPALDQIRLNDVLDRSQEFINWKRDRATTYVKRFTFSSTERLLVGLLTLYKALPSEAVVEVCEISKVDTAELARSLGRLVELNIIDLNGGQYSLLRPLRDALERDRRFSVSAQESDHFASILLRNLEQYGKDDSVPLGLLDPSSIAALRSKKIAKGWAANLILPSHYIWLARESYHNREFQAALEFARGALSLEASMTQEAKLEALRFGALSCARLGLEQEFNAIVAQIAKIPTRRARGNRHFLTGFFNRLDGNLETANSELARAADILKGSIDVQRELIGVLLARGENEAALEQATELIKRADHNAFALDAYIRSRTATEPNVEGLKYDAQFQEYLSRLQQVGDGPGLSFYSLRQSELALKAGNNEEALAWASKAVTATPTLPGAYAAKARALIAAKEYDKAWIEVQNLEGVGNRNTRIRDGLEKLVLYQVRFDYNLQRGRYDMCKFDVENAARFDPKLARGMKMDLVQAVARSGAKVDAGLVQWLKN